MRHKGSDKPISASIEILDLKSNMVIEKSRAREKGRYSVILESGRAYGVIVSAPGFYFLSENFDLSKEKQYREIRKDFYMLTLGSTGHLTLNNIFFARGSARILPPSRHELERLASLLKTNSRIKLEVQGHTD